MRIKISQVKRHGVECWAGAVLSDDGIILRDTIGMSKAGVWTVLSGFINNMIKQENAA